MAVDRFTMGYLCACQNLVAYMEHSLAEHIVRESGIPKDEFIEAQKESGFKDEAMAQIFDEVFPESEATDE